MVKIKINKTVKPLTWGKKKRVESYFLKCISIPKFLLLIESSVPQRLTNAFNSQHHEYLHDFSLLSHAAMSASGSGHKKLSLKKIIVWMLFIFHITRFSFSLVSLCLISMAFMLLYLSTHLGCQSQLNLVVFAYKKPTQTSKIDPVKVNKNVCISKASQDNPETCFLLIPA